MNYLCALFVINKNTSKTLNLKKTTKFYIVYNIVTTLAWDDFYISFNKLSAYIRTIHEYL